MMRFEHEQNVAAKVWSFNHNLTTRSPIMEYMVEIEGSLVRLMPVRVTVVDLNSVEIEWSVPRTGKVGVI